MDTCFEGARRHVTTLGLALGFTLAAGFTALAPAATPTAPGTPGTPIAPAVRSVAAQSAAAQAQPAMAPTRYERRVQHWINVRRDKHDLGRLRLASCTDNAAERWSGFLAANDEFYHQSMQDLLDRCDARYAGETLAMCTVSPKRVVKLWMHSPPHRHILLSKDPRRIGVGARPNAEGQWVVAANFMRF